MSTNTAIRIRPETRAKLDRIARDGRWKLTETVDVIADEYLRRHKVARIPSKGTARRNSSKPDSVRSSKPNSSASCGSERASAGSRRRARKQSA